MSKSSAPHTAPAKRRHTKAERDEHAYYARQSVARKLDQDLFRACLWIPVDQKGRFQQLAAQARTQHLSRLGVRVEDPKPPAKKPGRGGKPESDARQGELPL